jgi:glycosyltransferase involved in cell wall biosynthesis
MPGPPRVSVVVTTFNEEANVERAVRSARLLTDDVLVLDSGSTDRTVALAEALGARVMVRPFDDMASQRNAGLRDGGLRGAYALFLDADEQVTPAFAEALGRLLASDPSIDGVRVCRALHFWGRWVRSSSRFPRYIDRLVRVGAVRFRKDGHGESFEGGAKHVRLDVPLHDEDRKGLASLLDRQNRYARMEAAEDSRILSGETPATWSRRLRARLRRLPGWPTAVFLYYLVLRRGILEGAAGRAHGRVRALYEQLVQLHGRDLRRGGT